MAYAIIEAGGTQLRVEPGRFYDINRVASEESDSVTFDRVLLIENDGEVHIGQPTVEGATVEATVMEHRRGRKVIVYKMRPKKKTRKKQGHRQELTRLMIESISVNGAAIAGSRESEPADTSDAEVVDTPDVEAAEAVEAVSTEAE
jgi:large subunit ribosomal protein L21